MSRKHGWIVGALLALLTLVSLARSASSIGIPRDEAIYFEASRHHGAWLAQLMREPGKALDAKARDRHFAFNHEHPPAMKSLAGASARLFARAPASVDPDKPDPFAPEGGIFEAMDESAAMRLPAQLLAALSVLLLFVSGVAMGRRRGQGPLTSLAAGLLAAGAFILLPRVVFHASLHTFDLPIAAATLFVVLAYQRGRHSLRWSLVTALALGLSISIKHNALFVGPLLAVHHYLSLWLDRRAGRRVTRAQLLPPVLVLPAVLAPLILWLSWPWLWSHPVDRVAEYIEFHTRHSYYNMEFLGANYNRPPLPLAYPWLMTWATVPSALLLLGVAGLTLGIPASRAEDSAQPDAPWWRAGLLPLEAPRHERSLLAIFVFFPLVLISGPTIPIFGGTKHWLTAYPFLALAAARAWVEVWARLDSAPATVRRFGPIAALPLLLGPAAWSTLHGHPYNLSQYAPLVGGARGAAELGLNRGFWGHAALPLLETHADFEGRVYLHDLHGLAEYQYRREGRWPKGWRSASPDRAQAGIIFHERHMLSDEMRLWRGGEVGRPRDHVLLDDVPLTSWYAPE